MGIFEISNMPNFNEFWAFLILGAICLKGGKYLIKIIFGFEIEIGIFETSNVPNFNKFWAFSISDQFGTYRW